MARFQTVPTTKRLSHAPAGHGTILCDPTVGQDRRASAPAAPPAPEGPPPSAPSTGSTSPSSRRLTARPAPRGGPHRAPRTARRPAPRAPHTARPAPRHTGARSIVGTSGHRHAQHSGLGQRRARGDAGGDRPCGARMCARACGGGRPRAGRSSAPGSASRACEGAPPEPRARRRGSGDGGGGVAARGAVAVGGGGGDGGGGDEEAATVVPAVGEREGACGGAAGGRRLGWGTAAGQGREGRGRWRRVRAVEAATGDGGGGGGGRGAAFAAAIAAGVATCAAATRRPAPLTRAPPTRTLGRRPSVRTAAAPLTSQHNQVLQAVEAGGGHARASQCARVRQGTPSDTPGDALVSSHSSGLP